MPHPEHHLFLSYSRKDNRPTVDGGDGWITTFHRRLQAQHTAYTGRELKIFFDTKEIDHGSDWKARLGQGLRTSRLFLAFLSPNYMRSPNCRWEWEEYLRREHSLARGEDGIRTIFFEIVPGMPGVDGESVQTIEDELRADLEIARWLDMITEELQRRNAYLDPQEKHAAAGGLHPKAAFDLRPWFRKGPQVLAELDAAERLAELRQNPKLDTDDILTLADRLQSIDQHIATRLDRCLLADLAPGDRSLGRSYPHFVGRHRELRDLHQSLIADKIGLVTAVHGLGGQGKTALAIQYAHAYADFYAAGGRWYIQCAGVASMADAMMKLARQAELRFEVPPDIQADPTETVQFVLMRLKQFTKENASKLLKELGADRDRMSSDANLPKIAPRTLVILDNVDQPGLLSADHLALLPQSEWFELVVTTRLDPEDFGIGKDLRPIPVDSLPLDDAVALIRDFQPKQQFASIEDEDGARRLCEILGGFTLSVELAAAYLGQHPDVRPNDYCNLLIAKGLATHDSVASERVVAAQIRHCEKQFSIVFHQTLQQLQEADPRARFVLDHAAFLEPDSIMMDWLRDIAGERFPELAHGDTLRTTPGTGDPWYRVWRRLTGLRLLSDSGDSDVCQDDTMTMRGAVPRVVSQHRLVAAHLRHCITNHMPYVARLTNHAIQATHEFQSHWEHSTVDRWLLQPYGNNIRALLDWHRDSVELLHCCTILAKAEQQIGTLSRSESLVLVAMERLEELCKSKPLNNELIHAYLRALQAAAAVFDARGRSGDAAFSIALLEKARTILEDDDHLSTDAELRHRFQAQVYDSLGDAYTKRGLHNDDNQALSLYKEAGRLSFEYYSTHSSSIEAQISLIISMSKMADSLRHRNQPGDQDAALGLYEDYVEIAQGLTDAAPNSIRVADVLTFGLGRLADCLRDRSLVGDNERAGQLYLQADEIASAGQNLPDAFEKLRLAEFYLDRNASGDVELAAKFLHEAKEVRAFMCERNPESATAKRDFSMVLFCLARLYLQRDLPGDIEHAISELDESYRIRREIFALNPDSREVKHDLFSACKKLGDAQLRRSGVGDFESAFTYHLEAFQLISEICILSPTVGLTENLCRLFSSMVETYFHRGRNQDIAELLNFLIFSDELFRSISDRCAAPDLVATSLLQSKMLLAECYFKRGQQGDIELACNKTEEAVEFIRESSDLPPASEAETNLLNLIVKLGDAYQERGNAEKTIALLKQSHSVLEQTKKKRPESFEAARNVAVSFFQLAQVYMALSRDAEASNAIVGCYVILKHLQASGHVMDDIMSGLYSHLRPFFEALDDRGDDPFKPGN